MKKFVILTIVIIWAQSLIIAQNPIQSEKIVKDFINGKKITLREYITSSPEIISKRPSVANTNSSVELVWEATEDAAIFVEVVISDETYHCLVSRELNNHGWGYYNETSSTPVWEYFTGDFIRIPCDMTSDGTYMAGGAGNTIYGFTPSSGTPDATYSLANPDDEIFDLAISEDGNTVYFSSGSPCYISSVNIETLTENWSYALPSSGWTQAMSLSANGERLVVIQYSWVIVYSNTGDVLFQTGISAGSQTTPAISGDGNIFVTGDLEGNAIVYEYNAETETYDIKWQYLFEPGSYYDWASSVAISTDGSTIALGSLHFDGQQNSGELAVFNTESNVPIWIYESVHEEVSAIDITANGSIITAVSDGPLYDDDEDFWIFNKDSNVPFFEYNCQGSPYDVDISNDGTKCIVGGKAVHSTVYGNGGKLYYFNISQPPSVSGTVTDANTNDPLEGAAITLGTSYTDTTNSLGFYNIEDVVAGTYTLTCELTGYETYTTEIDVEGNETIDIELQILSGIDNPFALQNNVSVTNHPNPFNSETTISYCISLNNNVSIEIYDIQGKKIRTLLNKYQASGNHSVVWNGKDENGIPAGKGIYFYRLKTENIIFLRKMILMK